MSVVHKRVGDSKRNQGASPDRIRGAENGGAGGLQVSCGKFHGSPDFKILCHSSRYNSGNISILGRMCTYGYRSKRCNLQKFPNQRQSRKFSP